MKAIVNLEAAATLLRQVVQELQLNPWQPKSTFQTPIQAVMSGTHLTYRYILLTGLLAKAVNPQVNPLALQAGSELPGAYDARSLCHKVIVPLEREILEGKLGESNEPFLNKPARFKEISLENAVRRGRDYETLTQVFRIFNAIKPEEALDALKDAVFYIQKRQTRDIYAMLSEKAFDCETLQIMAFIEKFLTQSYEGETTVLVAGAALKVIFDHQLKHPVYKVHPVNQAGSSSKEIADIDIFDGDTPHLAVEVKDKVFVWSDVEHAAKKVMQANQTQMLFVTGPNAVVSSELIESARKTMLARGFYVHFTTVSDLVGLALIVNPQLSCGDFLLYMGDFAKAARVKDEILEHFQRCIADIT